jgi:hypothetical protein
MLRERGISMRGLAKSLKLDPAAVFHLVHGSRRLQLHEAAALARELSQPLGDVLERFGVQVPGGDLRGAPRGSPAALLEITGWLDRDLLAHLDAEGQDGLRGRRQAPAIPGADRDTRVLRCQTAGSDYDGMDGALVYYRELPSKTKGISADAVGRVGLVRVADSPALRLRVVRRGFQSGRFHLCSLAGKVIEEDARVEIVHPVLVIRFS